jgi:hypothetical protein
VSTRIGDICKGDYLIVSDINECAPTHGDVVCIAGRNCKLYKVSRCDNEVFVDNFAGTNLQKLSDLYNLNIYVVLFTITKYRTS